MPAALSPSVMGLDNASIAFRLAGFYIALFAFVGIAFPYWPVWLESRGLDPVEIGILLAAARWVTVLASPMIAQCADRRGERRRLLILLSTGMFGSYALFLFAREFWQFLLIAALVGLFHGPVGPLGESLTVLNAKQRGIDYGRVRLWGSLSFIAASVLGGLLLERWSEEIILWAILGSMLLTVFACITLPDTRAEPVSLRISAILKLALHPTFGLFLCTAALIAGSHAVVYAFGSLHWREAGIDDHMIGLLWAEGVIAEVLLFAWGARFVQRLGAARLLTIGALAGVLRWTLLGATTDLRLLFLAQALHALTFGASHLGAIAFIARAAPAGLSATAQTLYTTLAMGGTFTIVTPLAGPLFQAVGGKAFYAMAGLSIAAAAAALLLMRRWDGEAVRLATATVR